MEIKEQENVAKAQVQLEELKALSGRIKKKESKKSLEDYTPRVKAETHPTTLISEGSKKMESERGSSKFEINSLNLDAITSARSRKDRIEEMLKGNARERYLDKRKEDFIQFMQQHS